MRTPRHRPRPSCRTPGALRAPSPARAALAAAALAAAALLAAACPGETPMGAGPDGGCTPREDDCSDGRDDDCDGLFDCADPECEAQACRGAACGAPGTCRAGACDQQPAPAGTVCRPVSGDCDVEEVCEGGTLECPPEEFLPESYPCGTCSACDGYGGCIPVPDGTRCGEGEACLNGACLMCGGASQPCCDGTTCMGSGLACEDGVCLDPSAIPDGGPPEPDPPDGGVDPVPTRTVVMAADIVEVSHVARAKRVAALITSHTPAVDFITAGGDNARYPSQSALTLVEYFRTYWKPATAANWGQFDSILFPVPGNHEYNAPDARGHFIYFRDRLDAIAALGSYHGFANVEGKGYYSYDIAGWHFVALNSNCAAVGGCGASSPQGTWLRNDLERHADKPIIGYFHHPPFWCKSDNPFNTNATVRPLWNALHDAGADFLFAGHTHFYQRFKPLSRDLSTVVAADRGVRLFIVGNSGVDTAPPCTPQGAKVAAQAGGNDGVGAFFLTIGRDGSYAFQYRTLDGTVADSGSGFSRHRP